MQCDIREIDFDTILPIWQNELWPNRQSKIESHSAMMITPGVYDMGNFKLPVWYYGLYIDDKLAGVNCIHECTDKTIRLRGFWVAKNYRNRGLGSALLSRAACDAISGSYTLIWAFPRITSWPIFERLGYIRTSEWVQSETSEANTYCKLKLI